MVFSSSIVVTLVGSLCSTNEFIIGTSPKYLFCFLLYELNEYFLKFSFLFNFRKNDWIYLLIFYDISFENLNTAKFN
jgi:hypothetical protein